MTRLRAFAILIGMAFAIDPQANVSAASRTSTVPVQQRQAIQKPLAMTDIVKLIASSKAAMRANPAEAAALARKAELAVRLFPITDISRMTIAETEWLQGEALLRLNDPDRAAPIIEHGLQALSKIRRPLKLRGDLLLSRGGVQTVRANVAPALVDYQTAHNIYRALGETRSQAIALQQIASLYRESHDYETAMKYDSQSAEIYKGDLGLDVSNYNNKGNNLAEIGRFADAEVQYRLALNVARKLGSALLEARILGNIARTQLEENKVVEAGRTVALGLQISSRGEARGWHKKLLAIAAQAALQRGELDKAGALISSTFQGADLTETSLSFRDAHKTAYKTFNKIGRTDLALRHLEALKRLDDQTAKLAASANTALMAARFDDANKDAKIAKLKADDAMQSAAFEKARAQQERIALIGVVLASLIGATMLIYGLVTIRRSRNEVRAANVDLEASNTKLEKALAAKTEFLATTSHEIRTPLNGILGMTQVMLADRALEPATRDRLNVVHGAGITMRALVDDILDVAKMETGNLTLEAVPMDLRGTLRDVSKLWEEQARARGIGFAIELDQCPVMIEGDAARLRQIVFNLLSNAMKFTSHGSVRLRAETAGDSLIRIAVSDTGIGIPADKLDIIFESFRQVDAGTTRQYGGTGLGLSICRNLARAMGGNVEVSSVPGEGSTFAVLLPLRLATMLEDAAAPRASATLLLVDRNPISRSMFRALLTPRAGEIAFAGSADEAVSWIAGNSPLHVLIDDATAKAEDDVHQALALIAAAAQSKGAGISLLWPSPGGEERAALIATGVSRVIAKPVGGAALVEILYPGSSADDDSTATQDLVSRAA